MRIQFYMGHPAHFHLLKNIIQNIEKKSHEIAVLIKKKDILEDLLKEAGVTYQNILSEGRKDSKLGILIGMLKRDYRTWKFARKFKPDLLVGTSVENSHITKLSGIPSININEDDATAVPFYARFSYPWATDIISPSVCDNGKWEYKSTKYNGYHELAYLHPNHFSPDKSVVQKYFPPDTRYYIIRFAKLKAHHDKGVKGIDSVIATRLINILKNSGKVYITSERELEPEFEIHRMAINPKDMHHILAFATLYIGDSQTMAAEAGVLGTPFIRFNDFVDKLSYLKELEDKYQLGYGIKPNDEEELYQKVQELVQTKNLKELFSERRQNMLKDKIDTSEFMTWFIENYPASRETMLNNPDFQNKFKS